MGGAVEPIFSGGRLRLYIDFELDHYQAKVGLIENQLDHMIRP